MLKHLTTLTLQLFCFQSLACNFAIVTLNTDIQALRSNQVKMLYRGRISSIEGYPIRLMDLPKHSEYRQDFYHSLLNKSPTQMNAIWARQTFSGKAPAPSEITQVSIKDITWWLDNHPNGIAYVPINLIPEQAHVLFKLCNKG
ncbi:hypothetical protein L1D15_04325 [Vibrio sp. Isolate25]|uniref:hypothetical protein n=1 Tax=Vibrio TaxID=662 RepID=UPI001EFDA516|nr:MULTISPECIES: hypothetical protein [Vibrio]MCG9595945.1 hypothetical protein [Vibrio sp. Isolate25]MCG9677437.1 hypothetical protein [Vibrio sp. Isolate24]MCG9682127.1 hypothetical protein [Vibrio sp. Isolate23]USD35155.1 hypothetical protein J8Z27_17825 [Vibrio sp. SCSIO 43186]USD48220.1 hypothetical protein J4N38_18215 [Vibrio sp. SCSIO 43145]